MLVLGERLTPLAIVGGLLLLAGIVLAALPPLRRRSACRDTGRDSGLAVGFDTKIAIVLDEQLAVWQKANVTAFRINGIVATDPALVRGALQSLIQLVTKNPGTMIGPTTLTQRKYPLVEGTVGTDLYLTERGFETAFASDVPKKLADQMWAEQRPFSQEAFASLSGPPAWKTIPSWYLVATQDHAIPPATQMFMAHRANAKIFTVKASHVPMVSQPTATTNVILAAAETIN